MPARGRVKKVDPNGSVHLLFVIIFNPRGGVGGGGGGRGGREQGLLAGIYHKYVPAVQSVYQGFAKWKVKNPAIPRTRRVELQMTGA